MLSADSRSFVPWDGCSNRNKQKQQFSSVQFSSYFIQHNTVHSTFKFSYNYNYNCSSVHHLISSIRRHTQSRQLSQTCTNRQNNMNETRDLSCDLFMYTKHTNYKQTKKHCSKFKVKTSNSTAITIQKPDTVSQTVNPQPCSSDKGQLRLSQSLGVIIQNRI